MNHAHMTRLLQATLLAAALALASGCTKHPAQQAATSATQPNDSQLMTDVSNKMASDPGLSGQQIQAQVSSGVAVLTGTAESEAAKGLAGADAQQVSGIKSVVNNVSVVPPNATTVAPAAPPVAPRTAPREERRRHPERPVTSQNEPAPAPVPAPQQAYNPAPPQEHLPPPPPPKPVSRTFTLPAGTVVPVRMIDSLETGVTQSNTSFRASLAADLVEDGMVVVRQGSTVAGRVIEAKDATHYTGSSALTLELTRINAGNQSVAVVTDPYTEEGKGRGKNTAAKVGGGAALGAIIGAIAGGGKGAAIGSVAGGGIGAGANTITRGQQVSIPAETIVRFRLSAPMQVTTTPHVEQNYDNSQPTLQPKQY
jgi:hypothetical protein